MDVDSYVKTLKVVALLVLSVMLCSAGFAIECPPGFTWMRMSGVGCVQADCAKVGGSLSYTSDCICRDKKGCREPVNYSGFDKTKCGAFCPYSKLVACVDPKEPCPNEKKEATTTTSTVKATTSTSSPQVSSTTQAPTQTTLQVDLAAQNVWGPQNLPGDDERLKECREQCRKESGDKAVARLDPEHGTCLCECVEGYGYTYQSPSSCADCRKFCESSGSFKTYDPKGRTSGDEESQFLCHCKCNEWAKDTSSGSCKPDCPEHSTPKDNKCVCDDGFEMKGRTCVSNRTCRLSEKCSGGCNCPVGHTCQPDSQYADSRGCAPSFCEVDGKCDRSAGENCMTCPQDCGCESGVKCLPGEPGADNKGCIKTECNYDGKKDDGENCRHCPDAACPEGQLCLEHGEDSPKWSCLMNPPPMRATVRSANGGYVYVVRPYSAQRPIPLHPGDRLMEGDKIVLLQMPEGTEQTHIYLEWDDGKKGLAWVNRNTDVNQGSFYIGRTRSESHLEPRFDMLPFDIAVDITEGTFPSEQTYLGLSTEEIKDLSIFLVVDVLSAHPAVGVPNPVSVTYSLLLEPDDMGHTPMTFVNVKSKILLQSDGLGGYVLYTFEGAPEVGYIDASNNTVLMGVVNPGMSSRISAYAPPSKPEPFDPFETDLFWVGSDAAGGFTPGDMGGTGTGAAGTQTGEEGRLEVPGNMLIVGAGGLIVLAGILLLILSMVLLVTRGRKKKEKKEIPKKEKKEKTPRHTEERSLPEETEEAEDVDRESISGDVKYCTECGTPLDRTARYCTECGKRQDT